MSSAVNCKTASSSDLSLPFSGKSHANCHDLVAVDVDVDDDEEEDSIAEERAHALSRIALNRSKMSAQ